MRVVDAVTAMAAIVVLSLARGAAAETAASDTATLAQVFQLGEVVVTGERAKLDDGSLPADQIAAHNRADVSHALDLLPGITLNSGGARNESTVCVRGFDLRQVPLFIDGIPVYVPYDGYVDLARFTTADLAQMWRADLMPYGGLKQSGLGREGPRYAVQEMTEMKLVVLH